MKWLEALKQWNEEKGGRWTIPKKGTPEYEAVRGYQVRASPDPPMASDDADADAQDAEITRIVDDIEASLKIKAPRKSRAKTVQSE